VPESFGDANDDDWPGKGGITPPLAGAGADEGGSKGELIG
jgi:hypothetical protein